MNTEPSPAAPSGAGAPQPSKRFDFLPRLPQLFAGTVLLSAVIAVVLTLARPESGRFLRVLVFSESIGLAILAWNLALARFSPLRQLAPVHNIGLSMLAATPLGYLSGLALAHWALGEPVSVFAGDRSRAPDVMMTVLSGGLVAYLFWVRFRLQSERTARAEAQRLATEAQLRLLRAQLEPHMLFNTLATLRSLVEVDAPRAQRMIDQLITYLRAALAASRSDTTTLRQEFEQLRAYLEIMALRMGKRLSFGLDLPDDLAALPIPPMLLQPLVENAIRHGLEPQVGPGSLQVQARRCAEGIEISVRDSGLGLAPGAGPALAREDVEAGAVTTAPLGDAEPMASSYGLHHVRERLQALYGARASLALEPVAPHGVCATVTIPA